MNTGNDQSRLSLNLGNLTEDYARELLRYFARSPFKLMQQIIKTKRAYFNRYGREWLREHPRKDFDIELACLMMACRELYVSNRSLRFKDARGHEEILKADRLISEMRIEQAAAVIRKPRKKAKLDAIKVRLPMIMALRKKGHSWRAISFYLEQNAKLKVTHTYLRDSVRMLGGDLRWRDNEE